MEIDEFGQGRIDQALAKIERSEATKKLAFSSYTHAAFDQETRILTGDNLWQRFASQANELGCQTTALTWEFHPPGYLTEIALVGASSSGLVRTRIKSGFATMCWWSEITPEAQQALMSGVMSRDRWLSTEAFLQHNLKNVLTPRDLSDLMDRYQQLKDIYAQEIGGLTGGRLSDLSERLYDKLVKLTFPNLAQDLIIDKTSFFGSDLADQISQRAVQALDEGWLDRVGSSKGPSFIGGLFGSPVMINRAWGSGKFICSGISMKTGEALPDGRVMENEEVKDMLSQGLIKPTGILFDALILRGNKDLIIHDGNDYGIPARAAVSLGELVSTEYVKLFSDYKDSFPVVEFTDCYGEQTEVPNLASLFLWRSSPDIWEEKLIQAAKSGKPQRIKLPKEVY